MGTLSLFLLLLLPAAVTEDACGARSACLHIAICYGGSTAAKNSTRAEPTAYASPDLSSALSHKESCPLFGYISSMAIEFSSPSSFVITLETDLDDGGVAFGTEPTKNYLELRTNGNATASRLNGTELSLDSTTVSDKDDLLGRAVYAFHVQHPDGKAIHSLLSHPVSVLVGDTRISVNSSNFLDKLTCDAGSIHDACHEHTDCHEAVITNHSLRCASGSLMFKSNSAWVQARSAACSNKNWTFVTEKGEEESTQGTEIRCSKAMSNITTTTTTTVSTTSDVELETDDPDPEEPNDKPIAQVKKEEEEEKAKNEEKKAHDESLTLPGKSWYWIAGGAALVLVIISVNVVLCIICCKRLGGGRESRVSTTTKKSKKRNKGGKRNSDSFNQPSSTEDPAKPLNAPNYSPKPQQQSSDDLAVKSGVKSGGSAAAGSANTEMNLDRLKTERID